MSARNNPRVLRKHVQEIQRNFSISLSRCEKVLGFRVGVFSGCFFLLLVVFFGGGLFSILKYKGL